MSGIEDTAINGIEEAFSEGVPRWLTFFTREPQNALTALFEMTFYHGHLNTVEPDVLLTDWASSISQQFHEALDREMSVWFAERWRKTDRVPATADFTWQFALRSAANLKSVPHSTIGVLREHFHDAPRRIGTMTRNRASDPIGWYWLALSRVQPDDALVRHWFRLCNLVPGTPPFHGRWGLIGLRRAPDRSDVGFPVLALAGLRQFLLALNDYVEQRIIHPSTARSLALIECQALVRASSSAAWPREIWGSLEDLPKQPMAWVTAILGTQPSAAARKRHRWSGMRPAKDWRQRADEIVSMLSADAKRGLIAAYELLEEQRAYNEASGVTYGLVRSLCRFAKLLAPYREHVPLAITWAEEARNLEPWNAYTWATATRGWALGGNFDAAVSLGFEALDRFPDDPVVRNGLADVLKLAGRYEEAEAVYREALDRFPDNPVVRNGLADVLKLAGRYEEAEAVYREAFRLFPKNAFGWCGLADVLKLVGRYEEAEALYREALTLFPKNSFVWCGLADVLKLAGRYDEAEAVYREALGLFPREPVVRNGLADVLKLAGRYDEAEAVYREALGLFPGDPVVRSGLADVLKVQGRTEEAADVRDVGDSDTLLLGRPSTVSEEALVARPTVTTAPEAPNSPSLRAVIRRAITLKGEERRQELERVLVDIDEVLAQFGTDSDALYAKLEVLLVLKRQEEADALLAVLPPYLATRPEFLAMKGRVALAKLSAQETTRFSDSAVDSVVRPWEAASRAAKEFRYVPTLQRLRVGTMMFDGADLERFRDEAAKKLQESVAHRVESPARSSTRRNTLASWSLDLMRHALGVDPENQEGSYSQVAGELQIRADFFDSLEDELISAVRHLYTPQ
ncbi:tetratricopeptide repeat protein [Microbispora cellulosiformans]|uniref:Tetratricopeptide repeat protein n=1 Tax=Microbispora cellulosiformans TaxID=2614688 RepID=A0A5J5JWG8_9ACTN|nr:tetratricopeptide repeat protein [Microbispora cellulosiformans]KAA9376026.1 tetratricopeptide repeat protein [Microbispora cellulosiformans]